MKRPLKEKLFQMRILVVDDEPGFLEIFTSLLEIDGYTNVVTARDGRKALDILERGDPIDLVLTDVNMPDLDGVSLLERIKSNEGWASIPVIMISGAGQRKNVIRCIGYGAEDFLDKPLERELLWARVNASLERKYLRDREQELYERLEIEKDKSERVLYNIVPRRIADRMRQGEENIAEYIPSATVLFTDMLHFTYMAQQLSADKVVRMLNSVFLCFDRLADAFGLEKIKTVGDSYMVAGGIDGKGGDHADRCVAFGRAAIREVTKLKEEHEVEIRLRVGVASGPVIAGIIGRVRPMFDIWGSTVNLASRMESHGVPDHVQISQSTYELLSDASGFEEREAIEVKGIGQMSCYLSTDCMTVENVQE